jgi:predicted ATPase
MLKSLLDDGDDLVPLRRLIIEKTEGTPFFMEETVQMLYDQGALVRNGSTKAVRPLSELKIPPTVQAILASRIDRLPPDEKELLQTLAVIGREFPLSLVREVTNQSDDNLNRMLNDLQLGEFIYERPAVGNIEFEFKHALTQEVAYNSVLAERRKSLHERAGTAIETLYADNCADHLDDLAHHYSRSTNVSKAVHYLYQVILQCGMRSAHLEALSHVNLGLRLLETLPDGAERDRQEMLFQIRKGRSLYVNEGWSSLETARAYNRARELCERFGDKVQLFWVLDGLRLFHRWRLELEAARRLDEQLISIAEELNDPVKLAHAAGALGTTLLWMGELVTAHEQLQTVRGIDNRIHDELFSEPTDYEQMAAGLSFLSWDLAILGFLDQAATVSEQLLAWAQRQSRPVTLMLALLFARVCSINSVGMCSRRRSTAQLPVASRRSMGLSSIWGSPA